MERKCIRCGEPLPTEHPTQRCKTCSEKMTAYSKRYYRERKKASQCWGCSEPLPDNYTKVQCMACTEKRSARQRELGQQIKKQAMKAYGGPCACCGEAELAFVTIDHVNGDGRFDPRSVGGADFYRKLRAAGFPNDPPLQVLCWNCNLAKHQRGICPHQD